MLRCKITRKGGIDADLPYNDVTHLEEGETYPLDERNAQKWEKNGWLEIEGEERADLELEGQPAEKPTEKPPAAGKGKR